MDQTTKSGVFYALIAYILWSIAPVYFKVMQDIPALEILAHRIIWSCLITLGLILLFKKRHMLIAALRSNRARWALLASTVLIGLNWGVFIWAVNANLMLSASLGYYINPLINILLGMLFFRERLDRVRTLAVGLCVVAVLFELIQFGRLPWVALVLASTFGLYGLVRKKLGVDSFTGMALETGLLLPVAAGYLLFSSSPGSEPAQYTAVTYLLLFAAGPITMVPLMCFAAAANRISLTALGFFQYISPSGIFLLAVFVYDEPLSPSKLVTFGLIWTALGIMTVDSLRKWRQAERLLQPSAPAKVD
ncbi:chloramphenicol resistance permease RarD [Marinobacterium zhoushanense]|uniref:Chloramphenicol resistance permease RarD n=1 Tax=Marinobacterium zhoushanense TaxID=1679163 RepID=A0ABQ1K6D1_9GAMM|nr:EamA family transporter RarD [Marinobacterium zhoushanense]GGB84821.1 chloramphenicol resistance permease RarD [Marinobacterium zhoushanense]